MKRHIHFATLAATIAFLSPAAAQKAEIVAATDVGYAPFAFVADDGTYAGIDIEIAEALSAAMGITIKVIDQPWSSTFPGLAAGRFDMILAPAVINEERAESVLFTEPYADAPFGFLVRADSPAITGMEDLRNKTVATNKGSAFDRWITERAEEYSINVARYDKNSDAAQAVGTGQADAAIAFTSAAGWIARENEMFAVAPFQIDSGTHLGYAVNHKDPELRDRIETALECLKTRGVIAAAFEKWTGVAVAETDTARTPVPGFGAPNFKGYDETRHEVECSQ
ncbi:substrate-binding periplasmic protein [Mesorhizobium australicum]|uniref:Amino acid ABC transporter substrate-binding protein, PAAT family n=1 Tax=Mesorhizobium australicum TaxID=536018 RepID=A0A1X7MTS1_9HYPH|nr:transporter substrate-binding domain-containing protein [Mesorhizobium australicum]SMH27731.1 amino acid ABC transporter substrate-binding protein, PAAT family [Mesorhizobium australicum]